VLIAGLSSIAPEDADPEAVMFPLHFAAFGSVLGWLSALELIGHDISVWLSIEAQPFTCLLSEFVIVPTSFL
jgi:hypothetical protein